MPDSSTGQSSAEFTVKLDGFEGPLDLLLHFIEKRKLPINEVSLSAVTDSFIEHISTYAEFPMRQAAHFIHVASTLLLIKSKALLPSLDLTSEEEEGIEDLEKRLKLHRRFAALGKKILDIFNNNTRLFSRRVAGQRLVVFAPDKELSIPMLHGEMKSLVRKLPGADTKERKEATVTHVISLEDTIDQLARRITSAMRMSFKEFSRGDRGEKVDVIVSFLAMLELVKQGMISVRQERVFDDIEMHAGGKLQTDHA